MEYEWILRQMRVQDGALVEVLALDASFDAWVAVVAGLRREGYSVSLEREGIGDSIQLTQEMFAGLDSEYSRLSVVVGEQEWTSTTSSAAVIDFQGSPEMIRSPGDVDAVHRFMEDISRLSGCFVIFIPESINIETVGRYMEVSPTV